MARPPSQKTCSSPADPLPSLPAQKIKKDLIEKAKLKKDYAKVKARSAPDVASKRSVYDNQNDDDNDDDGAAQTHQLPEPTTEPHAARAELIASAAAGEPDPADAQPNPSSRGTTPHQRRERKPKPVPFRQEYEAAQQRKEEAEARRLAREQAEADRARKIEERERFRKAMAKARTGGKNGQRKLGRESKVLLERVKRIVAE